jgi:hypothetical protein
MLDTTRNMISPADLEELKARPEAADAARWIPLLVAEIERLRARLTDREGIDTSLRSQDRSREVKAGANFGGAE